MASRTRPTKPIQARTPVRQELCRACYVCRGNRRCPVLTLQILCSCLRTPFLTNKRITVESLRGFLLLWCRLDLNNSLPWRCLPEAVPGRDGQLGEVSY